MALPYLECYFLKMQDGQCKKRAVGTWFVLAGRSSERRLITQGERKHVCEVFLKLQSCDRTRGSGSISIRESRGTAPESHGSRFLMSWSKGHGENTESLKNHSCHESRFAGETEEQLWPLLKVLSTKGWTLCSEGEEKVSMACFRTH